MTRALRVLAILGGTFDPIHYGHLRLAADVRTAFSLSEVRLIPASIPPHRPQPVASAEHRFAMTALGCAEFAGLSRDTRLGTCGTWLSGGTPPKDELALWDGDMPWATSKDLGVYELADTEDHIKTVRGAGYIFAAARPKVKNATR